MYGNLSVQLAEIYFSVVARLGVIEKAYAPGSVKLVTQVIITAIPVQIA
tara:strand:- start:508 stop:654 length:147 start_codon:yes stop_codon:yes gene_type:complete